MVGGDKAGTGFGNNLGAAVYGVLSPKVETAVKRFQQGAGLTIDGIVGPATWAALPDGGPMPTLQEGSTGAVVSSLQTLLTNGAPGAVEHHAPGDRRQFWAAYESLRCGVSGLGWRRAGRGCRRPDLGCFLACGERHAGNSGGVTVRDRLIPNAANAA